MINSKITISGKRPPLPRTKSAEDFNPFLAPVRTAWPGGKEGKEGWLRN
jgi:hypothetical protein